jgi:UDP-N-acetylglucosamine diphosphorylase/glucosamine-1-phosphate N-acetyltransferase
MKNQQSRDIKDRCSIVILAAGLGTRMKSNKAKVLHEIVGKPMILYLVETAKQVVGNNIIVVVGHQADMVQAVVSKEAEVFFAFQEKQMGTGHAALCALPFIPCQAESIIILCGDVPMLTSDTIQRLITDHHQFDRDLTLLVVDVEKPTGYGRILFDDDHNLIKIVEEADATAEEKKIKTVNTGIYCVRKSFLFDALHKLNSNNAQGELYLTDIIGIGYLERKSLGIVVSANPEETIGVNSRDDLARVEHIVKQRYS